MNAEQAIDYINDTKQQVQNLLRERAHPVHCEMLIAPDAIDYAVACANEVVDDLFRHQLRNARRELGLYNSAHPTLPTEAL